MEQGKQHGILVQIVPADQFRLWDFSYCLPHGLGSEAHLHKLVCNEDAVYVGPFVQSAATSSAPDPVRWRKSVGRTLAEVLHPPLGDIQNLRNLRGAVKLCPTRMLRLLGRFHGSWQPFLEYATLTIVGGPKHYTVVPAFARRKTRCPKITT